MEKNPIGNALDGSKFGRSPESCQNPGLSLVESSECWLPIGRVDSRNIFKGGTLTILNLCQWMDIEENWQQLGIIGEWGTHLKVGSSGVYLYMIAIGIQLDLDWHPIGSHLGLNWHPILSQLTSDWIYIGSELASNWISICIHWHLFLPNSLSICLD